MDPLLTKLCNPASAPAIFPGMPGIGIESAIPVDGAMEILLVDDNELQAGTRKAILERSVAGTVVAHSAREALAVLRTDTRRRIGLIVTDHLMPEMNGPELVRELRHDLPEIPVLVLSGMPDAEREYEGQNVVFRLKPFAPLDLIRLAKHMLGSRALRSA